MSIRQIITFCCAIGVVAFALVGVLHAVDASANVARLSIALFAVAVGTTVGWVGARSASQRTEPRVGQQPDL